jgi:hypothetical protein
MTKKVWLWVIPFAALIFSMMLWNKFQPSHYQLAIQHRTIGANTPRYGIATLSFINGNDHLVVELDDEGKIFDADINLDDGQLVITGHKFGGVEHTLYLYFDKHGFVGVGYKIT